MARITFVPIRTIAPGYTAGVPYTRDFYAQDLGQSSKPVKHENVSIGGARETIFDRLEKIYSIETSEFPLEDRAFWRMFRDSVAAGEEFTFDPEGTTLTPSADLGTYKILGEVNEKLREPYWHTYAWKCVKV